MMRKENPEFSLGRDFKASLLSETREVRGVESIEEYVLQPGDSLPVAIPGLGIAPSGVVGVSP